MTRQQEEAIQLYNSILKLKDKDAIEVNITTRIEGRTVRGKYEIICIEFIDITPRPYNFKFEDIVEALILLRVDKLFVNTLKRRYKRQQRFGINKVMNTIKIALGEEVYNKVKEFLRN